MIAFRRNLLWQMQCQRKWISEVYSFHQFNLLFTFSNSLNSCAKRSVIPCNFIRFRCRVNPTYVLAQSQINPNEKFWLNSSFGGLASFHRNWLMPMINKVYLFHQYHLYFTFSRSFSCYPVTASGSYTTSSVICCDLIHFRVRLDTTNVLAFTPMTTDSKFRLNSSFEGFPSISLRCFYSTKPPTRSLRRRISKRNKLSSKPVLDQLKFQRAVSQLPPRFSTEELFNVMTLEDDPLVCFELFNWAAQQPRFKHDVCTYHVTIRKLGAAKMYQEMDDIVNQVLAVRHIGDENLYNSVIYYFTQARKLTRAVNIFKHMRSSRNLGYRPSIRTYHILFKALLSRGKNSYINHMYMATIRSLFKQMVDDGIQPDVFALNCMIKGYVLSLHVNDGLRVFHQMGVVYNCQPNSYSYNYLIHGLCAQGRTINARELCEEMKSKGLVPSSKSYNSLVNALALGGEVEEAVKCLWEMIGNRRSADFITYRTVLDEIYRRGKNEEAMRLLKTLQEKELVDGDAYKKLMHVLRG